MPQVPIEVVGGSTFGIYPKVSAAKTYNMYVNDGWLINYPGYRKVAIAGSGGQGRGLFHSIRSNILVSVIGRAVYKIDPGLGFQFVGNLETSIGEVSIDENLSGQICIVDGAKAYIYFIAGNSLTVQTSLGYAPNYVSYHNTNFLITRNPSEANPQIWEVFQYATDTTIERISVGFQFTLQTKPDKALAVIRIPGGGNNVIVFGGSVSEIWTQVGGADNYRRVQSLNIDYGCVSIHTIAANDRLVFWLARNELSQPVIMQMSGGAPKPVSTHGINDLLGSIQFPEQSTAFFYKQDGQLFYHITFFNEADNVSLFYHIESGLFYHASDENLNYHIARQIVSFNNSVYFVSLNDDCLYRMGSDIIDYDYTIEATTLGETIPRIRVCNTIRKPDTTRFRARELTMWIEQGLDPNYLSASQTDEVPQVDLSFSKNGGQSFSNILSFPMNINGHYRNRLTLPRLGIANELTIQLRFWGLQRFAVNTATVEID